LQSHRAGNRQTDHPCANDDGIHAINFNMLIHHNIYAFKSVNETRRNWAQ
jgi:hypothetical protein